MNKNLKIGLVFFVLSLGLVAIIVYTGQEGSGKSAPAKQAPLITEQAAPDPAVDSTFEIAREPAGEPSTSQSPPVETMAEPDERVEREAAEQTVQTATPAEPSSVPEGPFADSESVRAQETMKIDPPMREIGSAWMEDSAQRNNFSMPVPGGRDLEIEVERFEAIGDEGGEFIGKVKGSPDSSVRLSYRGRAEAGTIRLPSENRVYRILPGKSGEIVVQDRDLAMDEPSATMPPSGVDIPPMPNFTPPPPPEGLVAPTPNGPG